MQQEEVYMQEHAFRELAARQGLEVLRINGGYSINLPGVEHSFSSAMLTDYGLLEAKKICEYVS